MQSSSCLMRTTTANHPNPSSSTAADQHWKPNRHQFLSHCPTQRKDIQGLKRHRTNPTTESPMRQFRRMKSSCETNPTQRRSGCWALCFSFLSPSDSCTWQTLMFCLMRGKNCVAARCSLAQFCCFFHSSRRALGAAEKKWPKTA